MPRINVWLPDQLHRQLKERLGGLNVSQLLQEAIRGVLGCTHPQLECATCAEPIDQRELIARAMNEFYADLMWGLDAHIQRGGTVEGAARVVKDVGERHQVPAAARIPLPRLPRAVRERMKEAADDAVAPLPREADSRARHPTARPAPARRRSTRRRPEEDIA